MSYSRLDSSTVVEFIKDDGNIVGAKRVDEFYTKIPKSKAAEHFSRPCYILTLDDDQRVFEVFKQTSAKLVFMSYRKGGLTVITSGGSFQFNGRDPQNGIDICGDSWSVEVYSFCDEPSIIRKTLLQLGMKEKLYTESDLATDNQVMFLKRRGIDAQNMIKSEAGVIIGQIKKEQQELANIVKRDKEQYFLKNPLTLDGLDL